MVRIETSPEDLAGMAAAEGIVTARGGMTSHAAVVARGMGKCCVSGAGALNIDYKARTVEIDGVMLKEGDYLSINGSTGEIYLGEVKTKPAEVTGDFASLMDLCNKYTNSSYEQMQTLRTMQLQLVILVQSESDSAAQNTCSSKMRR